MPLAREANTRYIRAGGFHARLDDLYLRLGGARPVAIETAPVQQETIRTQQNPEEFSYDYGDLFGRSDFTGGMGLERAHRRNGDESDPTRYWDAEGIDASLPPVGQTAQLRLHHAVGVIDAGAPSTPRLTVDSTNRVYYASGTTVRTAADPLAASPTFASETPGGGTDVLDVAAAGDVVFAAAGAGGIRSRTSGGVWSAYQGATVANRCWWVKGRLLVASTAGGFATLIEVVDTTPANNRLLKTLASGQTFNDVIDAGAAILAAADDGYVYAFAADEATGVLELRAQSFFDGEKPVALGAAADVVFLSTRTQTAAGGQLGRLYRASLASSSLTLGDRQLLREWGDTATTHPAVPRRIVATRDNVYAVTRSADGTAVEVYRYDLVTGGLHRDVVYAVAAGGANEPYGLTVMDDRALFTYAGTGLLREQTTYVTSGYLIGPLGDFFTAAEKTWASARLEAEVTSPQVAELYYSNEPVALLDADHPSWTRVVSLASSESSPGEQALASVRGRYIAGKIVLTGDGSGTPTVRSFAFRGYPSSDEVIVQLTVNVSDIIERPNRQAKRSRHRGERIYSELVGKEGRGVLLTVYRPSLQIRGVLEQVAMQSSDLSERGRGETLALVRVRGRKVALSGSAFRGAVGTEAVGIPTIGL